MLLFPRLSSPLFATLALGMAFIPCTSAIGQAGTGEQEQKVSQHLASMFVGEYLGPL